MLPINYGDETATLVRVSRNGPKPVGIVLVKSGPGDDQQCPANCHRAVSWGRVYCPHLGKPINADRCKRMRKMTPERLTEYLARVVHELAEERRQRRQERNARKEEALRLAVEARKGKREPKGNGTGGKRVMTTQGTVVPQATSPKRQQTGAPRGKSQ